MAGVVRTVVVTVEVDRPERTCGDEARIPTSSVDEVAKEPQQQRLAVPATEATAGEEVGPALADESGLEEMLMVVSSDAEEDLLDDLIRQPRWHAVST